MALLDMEKEYDSVNRHKVWKVLRKKGVLKGIVVRARSIYEGNVSRVGGE